MPSLVEDSIQESFGEEHASIHFTPGRFRMFNDDIIKIEEIDGEIHLCMLASEMIEDLSEQGDYLVLDVRYEPSSKFLDFGNKLVADIVSGKTPKHLSLIPEKISAVIRKATDEEEEEINTLFINPG